jgi:hypothetical protein
MVREKSDQSRGGIRGAGLPCFLSGDVFYEMVVEFETWQKREAREAEARKQARGANAEALMLCKKEDRQGTMRCVASTRQWQCGRKLEKPPGPRKSASRSRNLGQGLSRRVLSDPNLQRQAMANRTTMITDRT